MQIVLEKSPLGKGKVIIRFTNQLSFSDVQTISDNQALISVDFGECYEDLKATDPQDWEYHLILERLKAKRALLIGLRNMAVQYPQMEEMEPTKEKPDVMLLRIKDLKEFIRTEAQLITICRDIVSKEFLANLLNNE